jgi:Ca2+-transporting ATPase
MNKNASAYYLKTIKESVKSLESDGINGLSNSEARKRLEIYGQNIISIKERWHFIKLAIEPFASWFVLVLAVSAGLSLYLGKLIESVVIVIILLINAIIFYLQNFTASRLTKSLQKQNEETCSVKREGKVLEVPVSMIVPGDILVLKEGSKVPADARIIEVNLLNTDESALTGESEKQSKTSEAIKQHAEIYNQSNMVFKGTFVSSGDAEALVVLTGMNTEFGSIAKLAKNKSPKSQLQKKIDILTKRLILIVLFIAVSTLLLKLFRGDNLIDSIRFVLSLTVSAIPEGLPIAVVIVMIFGVKSMAKENALVRNLSALETLGQVTLIATDKTGTITKNEFEVSGFWSPSERTNLGSVAYKSTIIKEGKGDELDKIIQSEFSGDIDSNAKFIRHLPFSQKLRMSGAVWKNHSTEATYIKGSVESVLAITNLTKQQKEVVLRKAQEFSKNGMRVIAFAAKNVSTENLDIKKLQSFSFAGIIALGDQIRPAVIDSVRQAHDAGIDVILLTGDHHETAGFFGKLSGISKNSEAFTGEVLESLSLQKIRELLKTQKAFGRVLPEHKYKILESVENYQITAMTGDGINDVPALRKANVGLAVGSGTDAAKEIADIIIMDNDFSTIVAAIRQGRAALMNIKKMLTYVLATNLGEIFTIVGALIIGLPLPITALQILWINVVTDSFTMIPLGLEKPEKDLLKSKPLKPNAPIIEKRRIVRMVLMALVMSALTLWLYSQVLKYDENAAKAVAFGSLVVVQWANALNSRSDNKSVFLTIFKPNWALYLGISIGLILQIIIMATPISAYLNTQALTALQVIMVVGVFIAMLLSGDLIKRLVPLKKLI